MRLIEYNNIRSIVSVINSIDPVRESFQSFCRGEVNVPDIQHLEMPYAGSGALHIKSAHIKGHEYCLVKVASTFPDNIKSDPPKPSINGAIMLFSAVDGQPAALLEDRAWITQARTAAAGAVAAEALAPPSPRVLGVIGAGQQARLQTEAIVHVQPSIEEIAVWGRSEEKTRACVEDIQKLFPGKKVRAASTPHDCAANADIVVATTYSRTPLLDVGDVRPGALVIGVGSDAHYKCEISPALIQSAQMVVVDSRKQNSVLGDIGRGIRENVFGPERMDAELGEVLMGTARKRAPEDTVICKLTGIAAQEAFVCDLVMKRLGTS
jgi:ornithine cyclodeaminase